MAILINPGSHITSRPEGWTNTFEMAKQEAARWLNDAHEEGLTDIEICREDQDEQDGRWSFWFRHKYTGVEVELLTHGIDDLDAYESQAIFTPRVYWNGSSTGTPCLDDFAAKGFRKFVTWVRDTG